MEGPLPYVGSCLRQLVRPAWGQLGNTSQIHMVNHRLGLIRSFVHWLKCIISRLRLRPISDSNRLLRHPSWLAMTPCSRIHSWPSNRVLGSTCSRVPSSKYALSGTLWTGISQMMGRRTNKTSSGPTLHRLRFLPILICHFRGWKMEWGFFFPLSNLTPGLIGFTVHP